MAQITGKPARRHSRPKSNDVLDRLRQQIIDGRMKPGQRLPTRAELLKQTGACSTTLQTAFNCLIEDGYVESRGSSGSFVSENPPHLSNVAMLVAPTNGQSKHSATFLKAAEIVGAERGVNIVPYEMPRWHITMNDIPRLLDDVSHLRVGSLIFTQGLLELVNTPILTEPNLPRVFVSSLPNQHGYPSVGADLSIFTEMAVRHLLDAGRRRIAHLYLDAAFHKPEIGERQLKELGNEVRDIWVQYLPVGEGTPLRAASRIVQLWMALEPDKRPDAIVLHDDHLVEHVITGLLHCGVRVPSDVEVVSLANFPSPQPDGLPVTRIGFDIVRLLNACIDLIEQQRTDPEFKPVFQVIRPIHESDFNTEPIHETPAPLSAIHSQ